MRFLLISSVWDSVPGRFPFADDVAASVASIAWTRVHAIAIRSTCVKGDLSEPDQRLTLRHVASRGAPDLHQIKCIK